MSKIKTFLTFVVGAAIGSATTYFLLHKKYESEVEIEVQEVREAYRKAHKNEVDGPAKEEDKSGPETSSWREHSSLDADRHAKAQASITKPIPKDYTTYYQPEDIEIEEPAEMEPIIKTSDFKPPYVLNPNDFGTIPSYTEMYLVLHPNGVLTDTETDEEVEDVEDLLGTEWDKNIGLYEVNTVRVRNERLSIDIEVEQLPPMEVRPMEEHPMIITASSTDGDSRKPHEV